MNAQITPRTIRLVSIELTELEADQIMVYLDQHFRYDHRVRDGYGRNAALWDLRETLKEMHRSETTGPTT